MKLLVTGGAGFIGGNFIRYVLNKYKDYRVFNLDKVTYAGNLENLRDLEKSPRYKFVKGDICDPSLVESLAKQVDAIVNFAAETHVDRSILEPGNFIRTDVYGTYILLEAAKKHKHWRYIQISTDEVYGSIEIGSFRENDPLNPSNPYSASKGGGDLLVHSYWYTYKLPVIITRSSNNFGPYQYPEKLIPLFITNALDDLSLPLYGDGKNVRDWLYVKDNAKGILRVMENGKIGEIYNIGGRNELTNNYVASLIAERFNVDIKYIQDRKGHDKRYSINCDKIEQELGWKPVKKFEDGLENTIKWHISEEKRKDS